MRSILRDAEALTDRYSHFPITRLRFTSSGRSITQPAKASSMAFSRVFLFDGEKTP